MTEETLSRAFDPFFTTKDVREGTGLGLATVFAIIRDHDGGVVVDSKRGEGTAFEIFLPVHTTEGGSLFPPRLGGGTETILLAEDEEVIAELYKTVLEGCGYSVEIFTDSLKALEAFERDPGKFDLVITDQNMPNLPGDVLSKKLLQIRPDLPIVLSSGDSTGMDEDRRAIGIRAFLPKPLSPEKIRQVVRDVLDGMM